MLKRSSSIEAPIEKNIMSRPVDQTSIGFKPNSSILFMRWISRTIISALRLTGRTRWSNEFIQALDPKLTTELSNGKRLTFRTGHGRLYWRATEPEGDEPLMDEWVSSFDERVVYWDIGACIGTYAMRAALQNAKVVAFEADVMNASLLAENLALNNLHEKVMLVPLALDTKTGSNVFFRRDGGSPGHALHSVAQPSGYLESFEGINVPIVTVSLSDALRLWSLDQPTHLKIDVDHNEFRILKGAENILPGVQEIYIETNSLIKEHGEIQSYLEQRGFKLSRQEAEIRPFNKDTVSNCLYTRR